MNRAQRRAASRSATKSVSSADRHRHTLAALDHLALAAHADTSVRGATLILPDGDVLHLDAETALAMADDTGRGAAEPIH